MDLNEICMAADEWLSQTQPADLLTMNATKLADLVREARTHMLTLAMCIGIAEGR